jgi:hypothetical protein
MEVTSPGSASMGPPARSSEEDANGTYDHMADQPNTGTLGGPNAAAAGAAAGAIGQQPKVVQTAFIHKLYKWVSYEG